MAVKPLECLRDYIGIRGCGRPDPESGLWINSLGINLENIDKIASPEQQNFLGVWDDVQTRALRRLEMAITAFFSQKYRLNKIKELVALGLTSIDTTAITPAGAQWRGFLYKAALQNGEPRSLLQQLNLQSVSVYVPVAGVNVTVAAFDANTGGRLNLGSFVSTVGFNEVKVNLQTFFTDVFIGYYATFNGVEIKLDQESACDCACSIDCCNGVLMGATVDAATINDFDVETLETGNNTFGMRAIFSLVCSWENFACATKSYFANALWYCLGEELMYETIYTSRLNKYSTIGKDAAKERRAEFKQRYHEELQLAVDCITLDTADCCIECNEQVIKEEVCP